MNKEYTGHEIFSHIIPPGINNVKKSGDNIIFEINDGNLIKGYLDKSSLSFSKNSIIHFVWDKWGPDKTRKFIDVLCNFKKVGNNLFTEKNTYGKEEAAQTMPNTIF